MQQRYALRVQRLIVVISDHNPRLGSHAYVAPNGSDQNPGTWESPLATLDAVSSSGCGRRHVIFSARYISRRVTAFKQR